MKVNLLYNIGEYDDNEYVSFEIPEKALKQFKKYMAQRADLIGEGTLKGVKKLSAKEYLEGLILPVKTEDELVRYWENAQEAKDKFYKLSVNFSGSVDSAWMYSKEEFIRQNFYSYNNYEIPRNKEIIKILDLL
jgi:hypothetical protein